jgi:hypothetical protein
MRTQTRSFRRFDPSLLTPSERGVFRRLDTAVKLQDYIDRIPVNFEETGDTCHSPRLVLRERKCHCIEAAFFAAAVFWSHGRPAWAVDLRANPYDWDHVVAVFMEKDRYGAVSKSNHAVLRYRDPVYANPRELIMSYFHEYMDFKGNKTLREWCRPYDLSRLGMDWVVADHGLWKVQNFLDDLPHEKILSGSNARILRKVDRIERRANELVQTAYKPKGKRF